MTGSAWAPQTAQLVNGNVQNDGSADSPRGYAISTNADLTMTIANTRVYVTATSANRTVTLPTTSVKAGMVVEVQTACTSPYTIAINSSGANLIDTLKGTKGSIKLMALVNTPTAAADWRVMEVYDEGAWTPTISAQTGSITSYTSAGTFARIGRSVSLNFKFTITNNGTGATNGALSGLPFTVDSSGASAACRSAGAGGHTIVIQIIAGTTIGTLWKYDNTYPFATNTDCVVSLTHQI